MKQLGVIISLFVWSFSLFSQDNLESDNYKKSTQEDYLNETMDDGNFNNDKWSEIKESYATYEYITEEESKEKSSNSNSNKEGNTEHNDGGKEGGYNGGKKQNKYGEGNTLPNDNSEYYNDYDPSIEPFEFRFPFMNGAIGVIIQIIFWGLIIAGIAFIIYLIIFQEGKDANKKVNIKDIIQEELPPSEIPKSELELALEEALRNQDYRKAIRIYFLFTIKDLSEMNYIFWKKEKTNYQYLREIKEPLLNSKFEKIIFPFEYAWYGKKEIKESQFLMIEPLFKDILSQLSKSPKNN